MKLIESLKIKEKAYIEKLENGLTVIIIPKNSSNKKYIIWGTHFGSIDNHFLMPDTGEEVFIPDGVAHFLEHKMFEQPNGTNSLDTLMSLGIEANAYTANDHTAYLFECTNNFYEGLDEFMDYVQNPYYTDENVEKEKGIIAQEIKMYDDDPGWQLYMQILDCLYKENEIKIDIAGTVESISKITPDILYKCYNTFYHPSNMALVVCGDFVPEEILNEIKSRLKQKECQNEIKRIYAKSEFGINKKTNEKKMEVSNPLVAIGIKDDNLECENIVRKHIAIEILLNLIIGKSSKTYKELYEDGIIMEEPDKSYEFSKNYAHIIISSQTTDENKFVEKIKQEIAYLKENGINKDDFERIKKKIYGIYVMEYNNIADISRMFLSDYLKGINSFDYLEEYNLVTKEYAENILNEVFKEENIAQAVIK